MSKQKHLADFLLGLYRKMLLIRRFEERVKFLFLEGIMPGTIHQCQGQEACAVGVCEALNIDDVITSTHRPHGHALAKGVSVDAAMAELFGKTTGCCKGKGGSMHMGDMAVGMVPAVAIVGGGVPIATGCALGFKLRGEKRVAAAFMGDGAVNEGAWHEAINMGAIWDLPVLYVVENNLYGASTPVKMVTRTKTIADRACAYGIEGVTVDGNDVLAVYEAAAKAVKKAREGQGPTLHPQHQRGLHHPRRYPLPQGWRAHAAGTGDLPHHGPFAARPGQLPAQGRARGRPGQRAAGSIREGSAGAQGGQPGGSGRAGRGGPGPDRAQCGKGHQRSASPPPGRPGRHVRGVTDARFEHS